MSEFWMWFWRPIAELLGVFALIIAVLFISAAFLTITMLVDMFKEWRKNVKRAKT
jgi:hypothetical protein